MHLGCGYSTTPQGSLDWFEVMFSLDVLAQFPIGCLKLQAIFRNRATDYRALLRKMTCKHKASCDYTPPCTRMKK